MTTPIIQHTHFAGVRALLVVTEQDDNLNGGNPLTLLIVPATGLYRVSIYSIITQVSSPGSSSLPSNTVGWTDPISGVTQSWQANSTIKGNSLTTFVENEMIVHALEGTNITLAQSGYNTTGGGQSMQFTIAASVEAL